MDGNLGFETIQDDREGGRFRVHRGVFTRDDVLETERRAIFDRCWLYLAHISEVRNPGDFISRRVGGRPVIFIRDRSGKLHVYFNSCAHRGALV
ncbi:MAG: Rieske 2Fe-2S domain-containing protein, partial [Hoeflea sp.]|nr:Rieske 2Fe-2S domain-containing protein [Hoeflea sp.]